MFLTREVILNCLPSLNIFRDAPSKIFENELSLVFQNMNQNREYSNKIAHILTGLADCLLLDDVNNSDLPYQMVFEMWFSECRHNPETHFLEIKKIMYRVFTPIHMLSKLKRAANRFKLVVPESFNLDGISERSARVICIRLPVVVKSRLDYICKRKGDSISNYARDALMNRLNGERVE